MEPPRTPVGVLAEGHFASALAAGVVARLNSGAAIRAAIGGGALLALAEPDDLPWAPGVIFLGEEHGLLLPTTLAPSVPVDLLATTVRQLVRSRGHESRCLAVIPGRVFAFDVSDLVSDPAALRAHAAACFG